MPGLLSTTDWVFDLSDPAYNSDWGEDEANTKKKSSDSDILKSMDLSSREDVAYYKPTPWTIAKLNAACRPLPISSEKLVPADKSRPKQSEMPKQLTIAQAFSNHSAPCGQSSKVPIICKNEHICKTQNSNVNHEGSPMGKTEAQLSHTDTRVFPDNPTALAEPVICSSTTLKLTSVSGNKYKLLVDTLNSDVNVLEPSFTSGTPSSRHVGRTNMNHLNSTPIENIYSSQNFQALSNARPVTSVKASDILPVSNFDLPIPPDSNITPLIPISGNIAPIPPYTVHHSDDSVKTYASVKNLSETGLQSVLDMNSTKEISNYYQPRTPSPKRYFHSYTRNMLTTPICSLPYPYVPIHTPLSASRPPLRRQNNLVVSDFPQPPAPIRSFGCVTSNLSDPYISPHRPSRTVTTPNKFNVDNNSNGFEGLTYQTPTFASTASELHHPRQHDAFHPFSPTYVPIDSSPSPSLGPYTRNTRPTSRPPPLSKEGRTVTAYAPVEDSEEWSTFPARKKRKKFASGVTTTRKFMLPVIIPTNMANVTPVKRTLTLYKPPPANSGNGCQDSIILKPRRARVEEMRRFGPFRTTASVASDNRDLDMLDQADATLKESTLAPISI